jgi:hypothetical protein
VPDELAVLVARVGLGERDPATDPQRTSMRFDRA